MDYYDTLGVSRTATEKEIRQAYRKLARKYHPDLHQGDAGAEAKFKIINEAYDVLSNTEKRSKYDKYGDNWKHADQLEAQKRQQGSPFDYTHRSRTGGRGSPYDYETLDLDDLLSGFGLGRRRPRTGTATPPAEMEAEVEVSLEEAYTGVKRTVTLTSNGKERRLEVSIPPGVETGSVVRISLPEGQRLLLKVTVSPDTRFERKGADLYMEQEVPVEDVVLGGETDVQTLDKNIRLKVPAGSYNGRRIRLAGQGMPVLQSPSHGDLYVVIRAAVPRNPSEEQKELFRRLKEIRAGKG